MRDEDQQTRVLHELCSMIVHILRSPPLPISFPSLLGQFILSSPAHSSSSPPSLQISPAAFGSLFFGISIALMLFGSVTFLIGFILLPLVITLVFLFYLVGIISNFSEFGRTILWPASASHKVASDGNTDDKIQLSCGDVNTNGNEEDGDHAKKEDGVDKNGNATRLHVDKPDGLALSRQLEKKSRRQHHEEHGCYHYRSPVSHLSFFARVWKKWW